jgi:NADH-quinone oxidoreductase subunit J
MTQQFLLFLGLAVVAIGSAIGMLLNRHAVYAALFLIINFGTVAVFYLLLGAPFIAMAQVTVYAGAIMVLFLFVIMLLGTEVIKNKPRQTWQRPVAIVLGVILVIEAGYLLLVQAGAQPPGGQIGPAFGSPAMVGDVLFSKYLLPFEVTSVLLLVAMVGAIVLTRRKT